ncbi:unnamed protein product [Protopolystoma xenopodis]|uniref:Uncharacterized protein n=1 Tax=Protopolystoma xenopodis TaxID=117903 RepID=A0A3S5CU70_9PLAT|nr:unnamed protein product [Protopolystoma xenopodis]
MNYITQVTIDMSYVKGADYIVEDTLYRFYMVSAVDDAKIDYQHMAEDQECNIAKSPLSKGPNRQ